MLPSAEMKSESTACSIHSSCERIVPLWLVLLDNIPTAVLFLLGAAIVGITWWPLAIPMMLYNLLSIALFWSRICPYCQHFGTRACPCGYGIIAARYNDKKESSDFGRIFRKNIVIMFPCWFIPLGAGIYLLSSRFSSTILILFSAFILVGFLLIPVISKLVGCKGCTLKDQCPWMSKEAGRFVSL
jgi:hypothetical protein